MKKHTDDDIMTAEVSAALDDLAKSAPPPTKESPPPVIIHSVSPPARRSSTTTELKRTDIVFDTNTLDPSSAQTINNNTTTKPLTKTRSFLGMFGGNKEVAATKIAVTASDDEVDDRIGSKVGKKHRNSVMVKKNKDSSNKEEKNTALQLNGTGAKESGGVGILNRIESFVFAPLASLKDSLEEATTDKSPPPKTETAEQPKRAIRKRDSIAIKKEKTTAKPSIP